MAWYVCGCWSWVSQMSGGGFTANDVGEHCCATSVVTTAMSGRPVAAPAWSTHASMSSTLFRNTAEVPTIAKSSAHALMVTLRASSALSFESRKSTTTLRPASPPFALTYLAQPFTPSTEPWNTPGASGVSTSATTAIRISLSVTPISVAVGLSPPELCATAAAAVAVMASTTVATSAIQRVCFTRSPLGSVTDAAWRPPVPGESDRELAFAQHRDYGVI